ncbi:MAG TPA: hypothetical protein VIH18_34060 [Candidatus Binatia bacterium]
MAKSVVTSDPHAIEQDNRPSNHYSYVLRCIGQDLEGVDLKSLEVKSQGDKFIVQGWSKKSSNTMDILRRYGPDDIKKLDEKGTVRRKHDSRPSNLLSLPQVLRFCGSYVDRLGGRLTRVSWQDQNDKMQSITIQFEPYEEGRRGKSDSQVTTIEELSIHVYKQRKKISTGVEKPWHRSGSTAFDGF